jgi:ABC-2 type transport system ATP-binding protein
MNAVSMRGLNKAYGDVAALTDVSFDVAEGEIVALLGPNGAGKSTLFELMLGLIQPTAGSLRVLGKTPGGDVRHRVGAMLQDGGLPGQVTVAELVRLVGRSYPSMLPVAEVLARTGLSEKCRRRISALSGGERQRTLLAAATIGAPALLLLDEPTSAMDLEARRSFWAHTRESIRDGATLVFATHDLREAEAIADRVLLIRGGRLVADGTTAELLRDTGSNDLETAYIRLTTNEPAIVQGAER